MTSTMGDDLPLTVTSILRHGATWHGEREVVTAEDEPGEGKQGTSRVSYEQIAADAAQLAHALPCPASYTMPWAWRVARRAGARPSRPA